MKIKFIKLPTTDGIIKVSLDGGQSFTEYNIADVRESGIPLEDSQDYEKIQIQARANIIKNLNVVLGVKVEGTGSTNEPSFIMDTDTYGFEFPNCVTGITLPNGMTIIRGVGGRSPFYGYPNLRTIVIPESVTSIGESAFEGCKGLTSVTIPDSVTSIGDNAFNICTGLTSITIPSSVTSIGENTFNSCNGLTSITIPNSVTSIGNNAFCGCSSLTSITIPNSVTSIGIGAFNFCKGLTSITIPEGVTSIGENTFNGCTSLTSVTIPESVTKIGNYAFRNCTGLKTINYTGTEGQWNAISKGGSWNQGCPSDMVINYNYKG